MCHEPFPPFPLGAMGTGLHSMGCPGLECSSGKNMLECLLLHSFSPSPPRQFHDCTTFSRAPSESLGELKDATLWTWSWVHAWSCLFTSLYSAQGTDPVRVFTFSSPQCLPGIPTSVDTSFCTGFLECSLDLINDFCSKEDGNVTQRPFQVLVVKCPFPATCSL